MVVPFIRRKLLGTYEFDISSRRNHTCAVTEDHSIECWGGNDDGQIDVPESLQ